MKDPGARLSLDALITSLSALMTDRDAMSDPNGLNIFAF
jgi:hypothetical protein